MQVVRDCRTIRSRQSSIVANKGDNADARQVDWSCFPSQTANCASPNGKESRKWPTSQKTFLKTVYFFKARSINVWQKQREQNATHAAPKALLDVAPVQTVPVKVGCVPLMVNAGWYVRRLPIVLPNTFHELTNLRSNVDLQGVGAWGGLLLKDVKWRQKRVVGGR